MAAFTSILAGASLVAGVGGKVLSAKQASSARRREEKAQAAREREAKNISDLDAANARVVEPAQFRLGASEASSVLFKRGERSGAQGASATGKSIGGLL